MIQEKLEIQDINIEKAHRVGSTSNTSPRTVVAKFSSFKGKQLVLSAAKKLKGQNIYINEYFSQETMDIRKEKWKSVKSLRSQGKYAILVYDKIVVKGNFRKRCLLFLFIITLEELYTLANMNPLQDLDISTEGHFEKQVFNPFDFQKVLIDEGNDPDINFFNDKSETVDTPHFSVDEFNSSSDKLLKKIFSILHINIRSLNKNLEKLREYLSVVKKDFSVVALTETWCNDEKAVQNSL